MVAAALRSGQAEVADHLFRDARHLPLRREGGGAAGGSRPAAWPPRGTEPGGGGETSRSSPRALSRLVRACQRFHIREERWRAGWANERLRGARRGQWGARGGAPAGPEGAPGPDPAPRPPLCPGAAPASSPQPPVISLRFPSVIPLLGSSAPR